MVKVLQTHNGFFVAFTDDVTLTPAEINAYKASSYNDSKIPNHYLFKEQFPHADSSLTRRLQKELQQCKPHQGNAINELANNNKLKNNIKQISLKNNCIPLFADYTISDNDLPLDFAQSGIPLRRKEEFFFPHYDEKQKCFVCCNKHGIQAHKTGTRATFDFKTKEIFIHDKVFFFSKKDAEIINRLNRQKENKQLKLDHLSPREYALYIFYFDAKTNFCNVEQKKYSIYHEFKHALTQTKIDQRKSRTNYEELSPKNLCLFNEDDEKAAHLQETYLGIASWYQSGGKLDNFPKKCQWLTDILKTMSYEEQARLLADNAFIVNGNIENWNKNYAALYSENSTEETAQLVSLSMDHAYDGPALRMQNNTKEYLSRRSIAYTIDVYNPHTQCFEKKDMSVYISHPSIIRENLRQYIDKAELIVSARKKQLKEDGITPQLIAELQNGNYKEPFQINKFHSIKEHVLAQGFSIKSKNKKGEDITIKANSKQTKNRLNCIEFTTYKENKPIYSFILDLDKKEYNCFNYKTNCKYSNLPNSKHPSLPQEVKSQIKNHLEQIQQHADFLTKQILQKRNKQNS